VEKWKKVNCWEVHSEDLSKLGTKGYYFLCKNGVPDGEVHVILKGNYFDIKYQGTGKRSGQLTQDDAIAEQTINKYFGKYSNK